MVGEAGDGAKAVERVRSLMPDLLFLDVQMPELDAFGVIEREPLDPMPVIVFLTAYEDFAVRAFEVDAVDYLLKPVSGERFEAAMDRVRQRLAERRRTVAGATDVLNTSVVVRGRTGKHVLSAEEIDWIEADDYYAAVHAGGRRHLVRESIASLESRLPATSYQRVHRGALVNLARVRSLVTSDQGSTELILRNGDRVPVSRRKRREVQERLRNR